MQAAPARIKAPPQSSMRHARTLPVQHIHRRHSLLFGVASSTIKVSSLVDATAVGEVTTMTDGSSGLSLEGSHAPHSAVQ